jgi:hypothetical protein
MMYQNQTGRDIEVVLERAREEEAVARAVEKPPRVRITRETKVADLDSPVLRVNRRAERRKYSTFNMMLLLFGVATAIVIYIGHIISVNHLAIEADKLAQQYDDLLLTRAKLQAEIDNKSGRERIVNLASGKLGLKPLTGQAQWIVVEDVSQ